jgi:hypothetical protein
MDLEPIGSVLETVGGCIPDNKEWILVVQFLYSCIHLFHNLSTQLHQLLMTYVRKYDGLSPWCRRLGMLRVKKTLSTAETPNVGICVQMVFSEICKEIANCMVAMLSCIASKVFHILLIVNFHQPYPVCVPQLQISHVIIKRNC